MLDTPHTPGPWDPTDYEGLMDEPTIYDRALSANEIQSMYLAGVVGKIGVCSVNVDSQNMDFGTANYGDFKQGHFILRNTGDIIVQTELDVDGVTFGNWYDSGTNSIILADKTDIYENGLGGTLLGTLDDAALTLSNILPDYLSPGNNDNRVDIETESILEQSFGGDLSLDVILINNGCL